MRETITETRPVVDADRLKSQYRSLNQKERTVIREKGRILIELKRGCSERDWLGTLSDLDINDRTARAQMQYALQTATIADCDLPSISSALGWSAEPTWKREEREELGTDSDMVENDGIEDAANDLIPPSEFERLVDNQNRLLVDRCPEDIGPDDDSAKTQKEDDAIERLFPSAQNRIPPIDERSRRAHRIASALTSARSQLSACFKVDNIHLTDVSTSPAEFEQVKGLIIEMVNDLLGELEAAGVLDGTEKRKQLKLLDGGKK